MSSIDQTALLDGFRDLLRESETFFRQCSQACVANLSQTSGGISRFLAWMDEVHKSLLLKVYVFIAEADQRWSAMERKLAEILFDFIWPCGDHRQDLRAAAGRVFAVAATLKWENLFRPFQEYPVLRDRVPELESLLVRLANLVAKADGQVSAAEVDRLRQLRDAIDQHLKRPTPLGAVAQAAPVPDRTPRAVPPVPSPAFPAPSSSTYADGGRQAAAPPPELQLADAAPPARSREQQLEEELKSLDVLVGLEDVKREVRTLVNFLKLQSQRSQAGLPTTKLNLHMVFAGNPGTGKTTVGRILGRILGAMGILARGQLVETDRSGLVAEYAGQTAVKTNKKVDEALDGVLFIDEAYSLIAESEDDPYGHEAVQCLLKRMEDDRKRLVVILAGYTGPMERLLRSNPGLSSRFNTKLTFADYTPVEMGHIFQVMCDEHHYRVTGPVQARLLVGFQLLFERRDDHFGNARVVRNVFEGAVRRLANRIAGRGDVTPELLTTFAPADIPFEGIPTDFWEKSEWRSWRFLIPCPACGDSNKAPGTFLGRRVRCLRCHHEFLASWGQPVRPAANT